MDPPMNPPTNNDQDTEQGDAEQPPLDPEWHFRALFRRFRMLRMAFEVLSQYRTSSKKAPFRTSRKGSVPTGKACSPLTRLVLVIVFTLLLHVGASAWKTREGSCFPFRDPQNKNELNLLVMWNGIMLFAIGFMVNEVAGFLEDRKPKHLVDAYLWLIYLSIIKVFEDMLAISKCGTVKKTECINGYIPMELTVQLGYLFWCVLAAVEFGYIMKKRLQHWGLKYE